MQITLLSHAWNLEGPRTSDVRTGRIVALSARVLVDEKKKRSMWQSMSVVTVHTVLDVRSLDVRVACFPPFLFFSFFFFVFFMSSLIVLPFITYM